jgi:phage shock protein C
MEYAHQSHTHKDTTTGSKKLYRSRHDRILAGVCGGLAEYFQIDPVLVRLVFAVLALGGGTGILLYIILAVIIPLEPGEGVSGIKKEKLEGLAREVQSRVKELAHEIKESIPEKKEASEEKRRDGRGRNILGLIIVAFGLILLIENIIPVRIFRADIFWPIVVVAVGLYLVFRSEK